MSKTSSSATPLPSSDLALAPGSLILVTGATGYIASHVVRELLALGYRVRGTSRSASKATISRETTHANNKNYTTVIIPDIGAANAFDEAIKDVDGVVHIATDTSLSGDAATTMATARDSTVNILKAAHDARPQTVRRVVVTSSSSAAVLPRVNEKFHVDADSWNVGSEQAVADALQSGKSDQLHPFIVYAASKTAAERAAWAFMDTNKPQFALNTILPNFNMGTMLPGAGVSPTVQSVLDAFHGKVPHEFFPPQYHVDVRDNARVHIGALLDTTVNGRRLFAFAEPFNWNDVLAIFRQVKPEAEIVPDIEGLGRDLSTVDNGDAEALLKKWFGQDGGWTSVEESVRNTLASGL